MISALLNNPLAQWGLGQTRRDKRSVVIVIVFMVIFYAIAGLIFILWASSGGIRAKYLCNMWLGLSFIVDGVLLLLWAPARVAAAIAKQRAEGMLDMLRMTGLSGRELAVGHLLTQMSLPLSLAISTAPVFLFGIGSEAGFVGTLRMALVLILLTPVYCMLGALAGLTVKKVQTAGGGGMMVAIGLLILGGIAIGIGEETREARILAFLSPWGQFRALDRETYFQLFVLGVGIPGDLIQTLFLAIISGALLGGVAQRYTSDDAVFLGRRGSLVFLFGICAIALVTWYPDPFPVNTHRWRNRDYLNQGPGLAFTLIVPLLALLWAALETPLSAQAYLRGMARHDPDDERLPEERFELGRFLGPAAIYGLFVLALLVPFGFAWAESLQRAGGLFQVSLPGILLGGAVALASYAFLLLAVQWAILVTRDIGVPRVLGGMAVLGVWILPVIAGAVLDEFGAPDELTSLAYGINPFYGIAAAAHSGSPDAGFGLGPSAIGLYCLAVQTFAAIGIFMALSPQRERLEDQAQSLVALPAEAYAAPGTLTQRCEAGHLFTAVWSSCPHCTPSAVRSDRAPAATPTAPSPEPVLAQAQTTLTRGATQTERTAPPRATAPTPEQDPVQRALARFAARSAPRGSDVLASDELETEDEAEAEAERNAFAEGDDLIRPAPEE